RCSSRTSVRSPAPRCIRWWRRSSRRCRIGGVREGEPSRTAWGAAVQRALHQDEAPLIFADPLAWRILGDDVDTTLWEGSRLRVFIAVRHRFAEDALADAVRRGVRQVVVL